jgi:hypothetical protein
MLPVAPGLNDTVSAMGYTGVTATVGLPGITRRLVDLTDPDEKPIIDKKLAEAFDAAIADTMARHLDEGASVQHARKASRSEAIQLQRSLNSLIRHARRFSARPLLAFDIGRIASDRNELSAWSAGGGVRLSAMTWGTELLFLHSRAHGAVGLPPNDNEVVLRVYFSKGAL